MVEYIATSDRREEELMVLQVHVLHVSRAWSCRDSVPGANNRDVRWHHDSAVSTFQTPPA